MIHNIKEYYTHTVKEKNLLIYSNSDFTQYTKIFEMFNSYKICNITDLSLENFGAYIVTNSIDAIFIDFIPEADKVYDILNSFNHRFSLMLYLGANTPKLHVGLINMSEAMIAEPFDEEMLMYKFFTMLNSDSAISAINNASNAMSKRPEVQSGQLDSYLDTYEGQILFLSESLQSNLEHLESGELSNALLNEISIQIDEVGKIFANHFYTKKVTHVFTKLSSYLRDLKLNEIKIENFEGFEYLTRIIEDINTYMIEYFVDRLFTNVYVFEDSLENSIQFMKDKLSNVADESSELEFF